MKAALAIAGVAAVAGIVYLYTRKAKLQVNALAVQPFYLSQLTFGASSKASVPARTEERPRYGMLPFVFTPEATGIEGSTRERRVFAAGSFW